MLDTSIYTHPTSDIIFEPFRPALQEHFLARFHQAAKALTMASLQERELIIQTEVEWAESAGGNPRQQTMYQAVWLLLRDLLRVGWTPGWNDATATFEIGQPTINAKSHSQEETRVHKETRRAMMAHERHTKLHEARDFIYRMELPMRGLPITALIADGRQIANELMRIAQVKDDGERHAALCNAVRPYLQLVEENVRCSFTGHLLGDIWRYFRLTWSTPAYNTPGRSLFYLVRDAARPNHPIMGIASLENAPIFIGVRDAYLGWTAESFIDDLLKEDCEDHYRGENLTFKARAAFEQLLSKIKTAVGEINADGLCTAGSMSNSV